VGNDRLAVGCFAIAGPAGDGSSGRAAGTVAPALPGCAAGGVGDAERCAVASLGPRRLPAIPPPIPVGGAIRAEVDARAANNLAACRSCSAVSSMLVPQRKQSAMHSHRRIDIGAPHSGHAHASTLPSSQIVAEPSWRPSASHMSVARLSAALPSAACDRPPRSWLAAVFWSDNSMLESLFAGILCSESVRTDHKTHPTERNKKHTAKRSA